MAIKQAKEFFEDIDIVEISPNANRVNPQLVIPAITRE
ncbi:hypothetical protein FHR92_003589 [Fontibacillus solani]|uniref:Uncharacterized protein n=1 Tax=Fontibacillus solani TaxID=1572857 RepID=A0A7W3XT06_9BACL|nr:hypothetical protein [Fontibacillus solani]